MKNLIEYRYTIESAMYNHLLRDNLTILLEEIQRCENHYRRKNNIDNDDERSIWFKFGNDTLATTKADIVHDLNLPLNHSNHTFMIEQMKEVCSLSPDVELMIYFS